MSVSLEAAAGRTTLVDDVDAAPEGASEVETGTPSTGRPSSTSATDGPLDDADAEGESGAIDALAGDRARDGASDDTDDDDTDDVRASDGVTVDEGADVHRTAPSDLAAPDGHDDEPADATGEATEDSDATSSAADDVDATATDRDAKPRRRSGGRRRERVANKREAALAKEGSTLPESGAEAPAGPSDATPNDASATDVTPGDDAVDAPVSRRQPSELGRSVRSLAAQDGTGSGTDGDEDAPAGPAGGGTDDRGDAANAETESRSEGLTFASRREVDVETPDDVPPPVVPVEGKRD